MQQKTTPWRNWAFLTAFGILTFLCWCPIVYAPYGPATRLGGIPIWAVLAFGWAALLFVLEWYYLFRSNLAMTDQDLPQTLAQLEAVDIHRSDVPQGD
jgi:hypothetical protein